MLCNPINLLTYVSFRSDDRSWLYRLYLAIDANFRLKLKDRGLKDVYLGPGWVYTVEDSKFKCHINKFGLQKIEVRTN